MSAGLVRLYTAYMFDEFAECDSDYVFVNLFAEPYGRPLRYQAVPQLVQRLRARTGISFTCTCSAIPGPPTCSAMVSASTWSRDCSPTARPRRRRKPTFTWTSTMSAPSSPGQGPGPRRILGERRPGPGVAGRPGRRRRSGTSVSYTHLTLPT